jgi:putative spermidine/putrescine transport system substrate-binding protein
VARRALTRREFLASTGAAAGGGLAASALAACGGGEAPAGAGEEPPAPTTPPAAAPAEKFTGTLRILGLGEDEAVLKQAEKDLGFTIAFEAVDALTWGEKAITQPGSFDIHRANPPVYDFIWSSGNLQPIDISRITRWSELTPVFSLGTVDGATACSFAPGDAPFRKLYVDPEQSGRWPTSPDTFAELDGLVVQWLDEATGQPIGEEPRFCTGVPRQHGTWSLAYNGDVIPQAPEEVSWAELLNGSWKGRVALFDLAGPSLLEVGLAAETLGLMSVENLGNLTKDEMDGLLAIVEDMNANGHFRAFWASGDEAIELMASGEVVVQTAWDVLVRALRAQDVPARYASPKEGWHAWAGTHGISARVTDPATLQACYDYINWWHTGFPGAVTVRYGDFPAVLETVRSEMEPGEYAYWVEGAPADKDYPGPFGDVSIRKGEVREGASLAQQGCRIAVWDAWHEVPDVYSHETLTNLLAG